MSTIQINTTQNVNIEFQQATVGERMGAALIDFVVMWAYIYVVFKISRALFPGLETIEYWSGRAVSDVLLLPVTMYTLLMETFLNGKTIGKLLLKIQVVKIDGYRATFSDYFTRWMLRIVDFYTFTPLVGILTMSSSKNGQRIGGLASGTSVISIKNRHKINATILQDIKENYKPRFPSVINLTDRDAQIIKNLYDSAKRSGDHKLLIKLRDKVEKITNTSRGDLTDFDYLSIIMKDYMYYTQDM